MLKLKNFGKLLTLIVLALCQFILLSINLSWPIQQSKFVWLREDKLVCIADFVRYYAAGEMARSIDSARIYELDAHFSHVNKVIEPFKIEHESSISFPPAAIAVMSFVSHLDLPIAYVTWCVSGSLFAFAAVMLFLIGGRQFTIIDASILSLLIFDSFTAFLNVRVGQWVFWLIGLYSLFFYSSLKKQETLSGVLLGLLTVKPQYVFPLVVISLVQGRWKMLLVSALTACFMTVYAASLIGWHNVMIYPDVAKNLGRLEGVGVVGPVQASVRGLLSNLFPAGLSFDISTNLYWLVLIVFAVVLWKYRTLVKQNLCWFWALGILLAMIFSPHSLNYDMTLFALPAVLTITTLSPMSVRNQKPLFFEIWLAIMLSYPIITWLFTIFVPKTFTFVYAFLNGALFLLGVLYLKNQTELSSDWQGKADDVADNNAR